MVAVEAGGLRFQVTEAIKGKLSWRTYFQDKFRPAFGGGFKSYSSARGPSVVATNVRGDECVIDVTNTMEEAQERAAAIEGDYDRMSTEDWCSKYNVPLSFVSP